jgi:multiple sugar transport system permease protein
MAAATQPNSINTSPWFGYQLRKLAAYGTVTMIAVIVAIAYLMPFGNMFIISLKSQEQLAGSTDSPILPLSAAQFEYEGREYPVYNVPGEDGVIHEWALVDAGRRASDFIDVNNPDAGTFEWEGNWRTLEPVRELEIHPENYPTAWGLLDFPLLFRNTLVIAITGMVGTLISSIMVAYAFARFPIPGKNILFIILVGTIILPTQVTLIPTYAFFAKIGWTGTWLPLIVPHFFANAYNVFLLRQFFLTLPRELDEAAMIDGAGPARVLWSVIIPQSWAAIIAVGLFHFIYAWNDYFGPLIYLLGQKDLQPISVGVQVFNFQYGPHPEYIQATSLMAMVLPLVIFFVAQKVFMRGVVVTGVEK